MKNLFFFACIFSAVLTGKAQDIPDFSTISIENCCSPAANDAALKAAVFLLSNAPDETNAAQKEAGVFLIGWMTNSPDYTFEIDEQTMKMTDGDTHLTMILMACMTEYVLKNTDKKDDAKLVRYHAVKRLVEFANTSSFKITANSDLKKAIAAHKKGSLETYVAGLE